MSSYNDWTVDTSHYELATTLARARSQAQWNRWMNDPTSVNLWITPWTTQNPNWEDAWFETERGGFYNGAGTTASPDAYEVTQNAYFIYCWLKYKGYHQYCILTLLTIIWNECNMGMGSWENSLCPYSFTFSTNPSSLIGWTPTRIGESGTNYNYGWHLNGAIIPASTAYALDEVTHVQYSLTRPQGSWEAYNQWEIDTYTDPDTGLERVRLVNGNPVFHESPNRLCAIGYGIVQWTNWTRLVQHAEMAFPNYGGSNWQFNATLQLMTMEWERATAMATDPSQQYGGSYHGEWVNNNATSAYLTINGVNYRYPSACSWDDWASGVHLAWVEETCATLGITDANTIIAYKQLMTFDIICRCYLHAGDAYHNNFNNLRDQRIYFAGAMTYWQANGYGDVRDIPRARELPVTELDQYHLSQSELVCCFLNNPMMRRRRRRVITVQL